MAFKELAGKAGVGLVYFFQNTWHYYRNWEHLLGRKSPSQNGWPFRAADGRELTYPPDALPQSDALMARTLVLPINIKMDEAIFGKVEQLVSEANNKFF